MSDHHQILLFAEGPREWAAVLVDGRLTDLVGEDQRCFDGPRVGEICAARVDRVAAGGRIAFLDIGGERDVYLGRAEGLSPGDQIVVRVDRYANEGKHARVSEAVPVVGERLIAMAGGDGVGVSRSISDRDERARLEEVMLPFAKQHRFIVRTIAEGAAADELATEAEQLLSRLEDLVEDAQRGEPRTLVPAPGPVERVLERWVDVDSLTLFGAGSDIERVVNEDSSGELELVADESALLEIDDLEGQIHELANSRVELGAGAWLAIEPTTALVAVDVNTGSGDLERRGPAEAALLASRELPRQLRLRGLAGIVVVDFPRLPEADEEAVDGELRAVLQQDYVGGRIFGWTEGGLYEFTRRRDRRSVGECFPDAVMP